jgi:hypothetical protein
MLWLAVAGTTGCTVSGSRAKGEGAPLPGAASCLWISNIRNWDVIDASTMIVYAPMAKDAYLVKLFQPIPDLSFHERIGFEDGNHNGQICSVGDDVFVRGPFPLRVPISAVRSLTIAEVSQLKGNGKSAAPAQPAAGTNGGTQAQPSGG